MPYHTSASSPTCQMVLYADPHSYAWSHRIWASEMGRWQVSESIASALVRLRGDAEESSGVAGKIGSRYHMRIQSLGKGTRS